MLRYEVSLVQYTNAGHTCCNICGTAGIAPLKHARAPSLEMGLKDVTEPSRMRRLLIGPEDARRAAYLESLY
jgi:hypothetical protein